MVFSRLPRSFLSISRRKFAMNPTILPVGPVQNSIHEKLTTRFRPKSLTVTNDSWKHRHHAAMKEVGGGNGETHFTVDIVSDEFRGKTLMQRHRMIYSLLSDELASSVHALSLHTKIDEEVKPHLQS